MVVSNVQKPRSSRVVAGWGTLSATMMVRKRAGAAPMVFCRTNRNETLFVDWSVATVLAVSTSAWTVWGYRSNPTRWAETIDHMDVHFSAGKRGAMLNKDGGRLPPLARDDWTIQLSTIYHSLHPGGAFATG
jgi:hypothetical protein